MRFQRTALVAAGALVAALWMMQPAAGQKEDRAEVLLRAAVKKELVDGDLKAAIEQYKQIVVSQSGNRPVAAKALLQMGQCYEKLGLTEARKAYERLLREYGDQREPVAEARTRLAALTKPTSSASGVVARQVWVGSAASAGISPDGRFLAYVGFGDALYVRDLVTGDDRRLTILALGIERVSSPTFSPDGKVVAYARSHRGRAELRLISLDGSAPRVLYRSDEVAGLTASDWSPDGKYILGLASAQNGTSQIVFVAVADGSVRVLKTLDPGFARTERSVNVRPNKISLSPDGRYVAYDLPARDASRMRDIFLLDINGGREFPLVTREGTGGFPVWTPDGRGVLFLSRGPGTNVRAWFLRVVDGKPQGSPELLKQNMGFIYPIGFARNGSFYYRVRSREPELYIATLDPASGAVAAQPAAVTQRANPGYADWSPDGQHLAYPSRRSSVQGEAGEQIIVIRSLASREEYELAPALSSLSEIRGWSADGRFLLVNGTDKERRAGVYRVDVRTGDVALDLHNKGVFSHPNWFLNERAIVFIRQDSGGEGSIILRDLETGHETELYRPVAPFSLGGCVEVSRDGQRLAFHVRDRETRATAVMVITSPGEKPRELGPRVQYPEDIGAILALTPDGRHVLFATVNREQDKGSKVWQIALESGSRQEIPLPMEKLAWVGRATFHPDGRRIAFANGDLFEKSEIWVMENFLPALKAGK